MARDTWTGRIGFILAAVGSAVGLGNIWRFPWMTAENGGSAFLLTYLVIVLGVGVPGLVATFVIGRRSNLNPVGAFKSLGGSRAWSLLGGLCVLTSLALISFYSVVGGWVLRYFVGSFTGAYFGDPAAYFNAVNFGLPAFMFQIIFLGITALIVVAGIKDGIEMATKFMMPAIAILLVGLAVWASQQANAMEGYQFYLSFDADYLANNFLAVVGSAAGQALFTLSIGGGTMLTYASYINDDRSLPFDASLIAILNLAIGVVAGLVVFPLLFTFADGPTGGGEGALFVSIAGAFADLPAGRLIGIAFFLVVLLAALTSSISMLEIPVSYLVDQFDIDRSKATGGMFSLVFVTGAINAFNAEVFALIAGPIVSLLMILGLMGFMFYAAWVLGPDAVDEYLSGAGPVSSAVAVPWRYAIGTVFPLFLLFSFYSDGLSVAGFSLSTTAILGLTLATGIPFILYLRMSGGAVPSESVETSD
ncbi:sodium-dependent transporter [Halostella sp. PRR32]|uniref:sodium-dependent transporter n=1 Tax=Halostella sp. PRR32 TaxID=3098147 RepID=UPI002B1D8CBD|nr:sodium-dependent transporter [Halostella sp. PRR32]